MSTGSAMRPLRLLPVTIGMCGLLFGAKCIDLGLRLVPGATSSGSSIVPAAQAAPAEPERQHAADKPKPASAPATSEPASHEPPAPPPVSAAERDLLQDLRGRRLELEARDKALAERESVLEAAEHRLTARISELSGLQARLEQLDSERHAHDEANWAGIVKVYETMKPREAAAIFNDMELPVLLQVVDRMKDTKASQVLAAMQPDRARLLTSQLAAQRTRSVTVPDRAGAS